MASRSEGKPVRHFFISRARARILASLLARTFPGLVALGCVAENAGYSDVRDATAARLGKSVSWRARESRDDSAAQSDALLKKPLDADAAVALCLANNQALQASFEKLGVARGEWVHALSLPNPSLGAAIRWGASDRPELDLDATISLTRLLFLPWRSGAGAARLDVAKIDVVRDIALFAFETRVLFFAYQGAKQQTELRQSVFAATDASRDMAERMHRAGNVTDLNLASQRALHEEARIALARAKARERAAREDLNARMGLSGERAARWTLLARLADPQPIAALLANLERRAAAQSLDLELARRRFREASRRATVARLDGWVPELRAGVSAERGEGDWGIGPRAELELPLFYQGQGDVAVAIAEMRRQRGLFVDRDAHVRARARALSALLTETAESVAYYRGTLLPLREEIVRQTQLEYNAMGTGLFQLLQAKREQILAAQTYVDILRDYWTLRSEVETLLAGVLPRATSTGADATATSSGSSEAAASH